MGRALRSILVLVAIGLITTVTVAWVVWGAARRTLLVLTDSGLSAWGGPRWHRSAYEAPGSRWEIGWPIHDRADELGAWRLQQEQGKEWIWFPRGEGSRWSHTLVQPPAKDDHRLLCLGFCGWPLPALATPLRQDVTDKVSHFTGTTSAGHRQLIAGASLPLRPLWAGFLVDSALYAAAWLAIWSIVRILVFALQGYSGTRLAMLAASLLAAGAAATWIVAWSCALTLTLGAHHLLGFGSDGWEDGENVSPGAWLVGRSQGPGLTSYHVTGYGQPDPTTVVVTMSSTPAAKLLPGWAECDVHVGDTESRIGFSAAGWPLRALWYAEDLRSAQVHRGIALPFRPPRPASRPEHLRALPIRPIWPGLAADAFFYAILLAAPALAPRALRRFLRIRRGLCPACSYPAGSSAICTECGNAIAVRYGGLSPAVECSAPGSGAGACGIGAGAAASGTSTE